MAYYKVVKLTPELEKYIRQVAGNRYGYQLSTAKLIYLMTKHIARCPTKTC